MSPTAPRPTGPDEADGAPAAPPAADPRPDPATAVRSADDADVGWGDDADRAEDGGRDARWYEEQRPPHWE